MANDTKKEQVQAELLKKFTEQMNALLKKWDAKKTPKEVVIVVDDEKKGTWHLELK